MLSEETKQVIAPYIEDMCKYQARRVGVDWKELVQDAWVAILRTGVLDLEGPGYKAYIQMAIRGVLLQRHKHEEQLSPKIIYTDEIEAIGPLGTLSNHVYIAELRNAIEENLSRLTARQQRILRLFYGLDCDSWGLGCYNNMASIGKEVGLSREGVRQEMLKSIKRIKHPKNPVKHKLTKFLERDQLHGRPTEALPGTDRDQPEAHSCY